MQDLKLRILSYNIHWGRSAFRRHVIEDRLVQTIIREKCDIVLLQELWFREGEVLRSLLDHLEEEWEHRIIGPTVKFAQGAQGNGLLSRYPIGRWINHPIPHRHFQKRALLHAELLLPGDRTLAVICTHFGLNGRERQAQAEDLCRFIEAEVESSQALIIGGDFNDWSCTLSRFLAEKLGLKEVFLETKGQHARTFPAIFPLLRLDRVYTRGLIIESARVVHEAGWQGSSDHLPLAADLILPTEETQSPILPRS